VSREVLAADWVHPSVRDTIIEYLRTHDSYRERFLATAQASGAVMALSTAGGAHGNLDRPLLRNLEDWNALKDTIKRIGSSSDFREQYVLIQGVEEAVRSSKSEKDAYDLIRTLAIELLSAVRDSWGSPTKGVTVRALRLFYSLSVQIDYLVPSPNLHPIWREVATSVELALSGNVGSSGLDRANQWIAIVKLLRENEPRFLLMRINEAAESKTAGIDQTLRRVLEWVREWSEGLEDLDQDETRWVEESGNLIEIPIEPDPYESDEAFTLTEAIDAVEAVMEMSDELAENASDLIYKMQGQREAREARQAQWEAWDEEQSRDAYEQPETEIEDETRPFDITEFFSDL
jgi:hypothetical protein